MTLKGTLFQLMSNFKGVISFSLSHTWLTSPRNSRVLDLFSTVMQEILRDFFFNVAHL